MKIKVNTFKELDTISLYEILRLRSKVFVVEQNCIYQDIDGKDNKALHIIGKKRDRIVAYTRCFASGIYFKEAAIGRVVVDKQERTYGYGHTIMETSIKAIYDTYGIQNIKLSAQIHLVSFYNAHGFIPIGKEYLEDGIPHIAMIKQPTTTVL